MKKTDADETLNELLVTLFKDLTEIEGKCLITDEYRDLTMNDMHVIEAIGVESKKRMSTVSHLMGVTTGTLTKAMDGLVKKGYVTREKDEEDKRAIRVSLTDKGTAAYYHHEQFHTHMIEHIKSELEGEELEILVQALAKLVDYFEHSYNDEDGEPVYASWSSIREDNN